MSELIYDVPREDQAISYGYARCSTGDQKNSIGVQEDAIARYFTYALEPKGYERGPIVADEGVSGGTVFAQRPGGGRLMTLLRKGDALVIAKLDRGFRNTMDLLVTTEALRERGVRLCLLDISIEDTESATGKFFVRLIGLIAEWERDRITERINETRRIRQKAGMAVGPVPYGFRKVRKPGHDGVEHPFLEPHPEERAVCEAIVTWRDKEQWRWQEIADHLNDHNISNHKGTLWTRRQVQTAYEAELRMRLKSVDKP